MNIASSFKRTAKHTVGAALLAGALLMAPTAADARVFISVSIAPPVIPVYEQPLCPGDGYIWTPGYWAWNDYNAGYEWVEGSWVVAPYVGALWTPGYWGYNNGTYLWNAGYWGREVGYYGGVNYGFGYFGTGFYGGYWGGDRFFYNRAYNRVDERREHNLYERREAGFDGRPGGASFDHRYAEHGGFDGNRGSFAGRGGFDDRRSFNGQENRGINPGEARNFSGTNNRQPFQGDQGLNNRQQWQGGQNTSHTNYQTDPNRQFPNQGFQGGNRSAYQPQPNQPAQPNQDQRSSGNRSGFQAQQPQPQQPRQDQGYTGGRSNFPTQPSQNRPDQRFSDGDFRGNAIRSNNAPAVNRNNQGGFRGSPASAAPQQGGGNPQGGSFRSGDNRSGGHR